MTQADLVTNIGNTITKLDTQLMSGKPPSGTAEWQQLYAMRKHLDDQQRDLLAATIEADDTQYAAATATIETAIKELDKEIAAESKIDSIIKTVSVISNGVDQVLKQI